MHTRLTRHVTIENSLRRAIGTPELYLVYQPIVDLFTRRMVSAEALLRWKHPTLGVISPSEFIPIAEETGLIVALGEWVQNEACRTMAGWREQHPERAPATISVNVSRAELALGERLLVQVLDILRRLALPPQCLLLQPSGVAGIAARCHRGATHAHNGGVVPRVPCRTRRNGATASRRPSQ
jgi:EAL domain-containing protein (putative c-di-GMP-specific phosphodiesterase class I)